MQSTPQAFYVIHDTCFVVDLCGKDVDYFDTYRLWQTKLKNKVTIC